MPTYEYLCQKCKKGFEVFQSMKDDRLEVCPKEHCRMKTWGKGKVVRQLGTGAGLIFKGSGFYITDYRSEGYKSAAQKDASASQAASTSSSSGGGESGGSGGGEKKAASSESKPASASPPPASKKNKSKKGD